MENSDEGMPKEDVKSKGDEKRINIWTNDSNASESQSANFYRFSLPLMLVLTILVY